MPGTRGIRAGRAFVELFADDKKLVRGLRRAEKKLKAFGQSVRNLGLKMAGLGAATVFKLLGGVIAFLVSPIGAAIAAVAALGAYLVYATGAGGKALTWLGGKFNMLKEDAVSAFQGISDAIATGDMGLAMKVLWLTLKMEWTRGVNFLEKAWKSCNVQ